MVCIRLLKPQYDSIMTTRHVDLTAKEHITLVGTPSDISAILSAKAKNKPNTQVEYRCGNINQKEGNGVLYTNRHKSELYTNRHKSEIRFKFVSDEEGNVLQIASIVIELSSNFNLRIHPPSSLQHGRTDRHSSRADDSQTGPFRWPYRPNPAAQDWPATKQFRKDEMCW